MIEPPTLARYSQLYAVRFVDKLGNGKDGDVLKTSDGHAVKFLTENDAFQRELRAYQILRHSDMDQINGFQIPRLIRHDQPLRAIEMTIVDAPFILDFAAAYTQAECDRFDFSEDVILERQAYWAEIFGDRWPFVQQRCDAFTEATGLILLDLSLNNIKFPQ